MAWISWGKCSEELKKEQYPYIEFIMVQIEIVKNNNTKQDKNVGIGGVSQGMSNFTGCIIDFGYVQGN